MSVNTKIQMFVMDSLGGIFPISPSLKQQIAQVYGGKRSVLIICRLSVQQQVKSKNYELLAAAFAIEGMIPPECHMTIVRCTHTLHLALERATWTLSFKEEIPRRICYIPRPKGQSTSWLNQHAGVEAATRDIIYDHL